MSVFLMLFLLTLPLAFAAIGILWLIFIAVGIFEPGGRRWRLWKIQPKPYLTGFLLLPETWLPGKTAIAAAPVAWRISFEDTGEARLGPSGRVFIRNGGRDESTDAFQTAAGGDSKFLLAAP